MIILDVRWSGRFDARQLCGWVAACWFGLTMLGHAISAPVIEEVSGTELSVTVSRDRIRWGEEVEITVSALNSTGSTVSGGLYVSFDDDVLVLEAAGGTVLRPGATAYNLKTANSRPMVRPLVEAWDENWNPGVERRLVVVVLPIARDRVRVLVRATFVGPASQPRIHISPGRMESRSRDETEFPTKVAYLWISRHASLRRAIRGIERRMRHLEPSEQTRFAHALAAALNDPQALNDLLPHADRTDLKNYMQALRTMVPRVSERLKWDPLDALDHLRCLMADLACRRGLVYFGVPLSIYEDLNYAQAARLNAQNVIMNDKGGTVLIALIEAEGFTYLQEKSTGAIVVQLEAGSVSHQPHGPVVNGLLEQIIAKLGPAAEKTHASVNHMSFTLLRKQLSAP